MCRLFALRSDSPRPAFGPLWSEPNALARQSCAHADGWGLAHLSRGRVRVVRDVAPAHQSRDFRAHAEALRSELVLAHVRKASVGPNELSNTHPFEHEGWVFAHNGTLRAFASRRGEIERRIDPALRRHLSGETDSERCFFLFLGELAKDTRGELIDRAGRALGRVARYIRATDPPDVPRPSVANFVATNGDALLALRFGKMLHLAAEGCDGPVRDGTPVRALLVSSEPTDSRRHWRALAHGQGLGIDARMVVRRFQVP